MISGSFAKNDPQLKAFYGSLPPCMTQSTDTRTNTDTDTDTGIDTQTQT